MITASFRATATAARLKPILSRSWRPHVRKLLPVELRVRIVRRNEKLTPKRNEELTPRF